jgi:hypothetical protein
MTADVFVRFLERKLTEHGIRKVVPGDDVLEQHAPQVLVGALTNKASLSRRCSFLASGHKHRRSPSMIMGGQPPPPVARISDDRAPILVIK